MSSINPDPKEQAEALIRGFQKGNRVGVDEQGRFVVVQSGKHDEEIDTNMATVSRFINRFINEHGKEIGKEQLESIKKSVEERTTDLRGRLRWVPNLFISKSTKNALTKMEGISQQVSKVASQTTFPTESARKTESFASAGRLQGKEETTPRSSPEASPRPTRRASVQPNGSQTAPKIEEAPMAPLAPEEIPGNFPPPPPPPGGMPPPPPLPGMGPTPVVKKPKFEGQPDAPKFNVTQIPQDKREIETQLKEMEAYAGIMRNAKGEVVADPSKGLSKIVENISTRLYQYTSHDIALKEKKDQLSAVQNQLTNSTNALKKIETHEKLLKEGKVSSTYTTLIFEGGEIPVYNDDYLKKLSPEAKKQLEISEDALSQSRVKEELKAIIKEGQRQQEELLKDIRTIEDYLKFLSASKDGEIPFLDFEKNRDLLKNERDKFIRFYKNRLEALVGKQPKAPSPTESLTKAEQVLAQYPDLSALQNFKKANSSKVAGLKKVSEGFYKKLS